MPTTLHRMFRHFLRSRATGPRSPGPRRMSGRGLKARATQVCGGCPVAGYRPALPGAAVDVRSRAKSPRYKGRAIQGRGGCQETRAKSPRYKVRGGCQVAGYRPALPSSAADVRSRAKSPRYKGRATWGRGGCQETRAKGPRYKARATQVCGGCQVAG